MNDTGTRFGVDVHKLTSRVTRRNEEGKIVGRERLDHRDRGRFRERIRRWPTGSTVVLESSFGWGWVFDELEAAGLSPRLANSRKVAAWRAARGIVKTDRTDADLLSELPMEKEPWWEVWPAPPEVRAAREWLRYRMTLVRFQTGLKNRIHAVLHRHGIVCEVSDLFGTAGRKLLKQLASPDDATLPDSAQATLRGYLELLDHVRRMIAQATRSLRKQLTETPVGKRLRSLPGISWVLGFVIFAEVGRLGRFRNAKHLCSYSLLAPRSDESGEPDEDSPKGRHVGKIGRRMLKWAFIEAAHGAVRKGGRFRKLFDRRTNGGKKDKNRGYITVGHALCRVAYAVWRDEVMYTETPPPRPGQDGGKRSSKGCGTSRSGMGQPEHPMIVGAG